jgi:hypothetical protein
MARYNAGKGQHRRCAWCDRLLALQLSQCNRGCGSGSGQPGTGITAQASDATATAEVRAVLDKYVQAVKSADENLLREVWAQPDNVSYVNPMQRLRSWGELQGFWQGFLKNSFTQRELTLNNVAIQGIW